MTSSSASINAPGKNAVDRTFSVAPMMDYTDRHCRYFHRLISQHTLLYTEMVTTGAIIHGDKTRHLFFDPFEHPVALQLGGSDPGDLALCSKLASDMNYDEINLNCGCPSDRVVSGKFGAIMMKEPDLVADCVKAMVDGSDTPVTVKHRIGVDDLDSYAFLCDFVGRVADAGCETFIVHARKAWLSGLSPKQNREIPPLDCERVYQLKLDFPELEIIINGGIKTLEETSDHLKHVDGVMMGREAYHNPYILADVDRLFYGSEQEPPSRTTILQQFNDYMADQCEGGLKPSNLTRHILGLFQGMPGARKFRRYISERAHLVESGDTLLIDALAELGRYHPQTNLTSNP
ncbi:MAG: tRNA dihydrouridine(20/20a) synthase DusA [bacterium]